MTGGGDASSGGGVATTGGGSASTGGGSATQPCTTRITYGSNWIHGTNHPNDSDDVSGAVTWDGVCTPDGSGNSYATLSNGWTPYFTGNSGCIIAIDSSASCTPAPPASCQTRISYGSTWSRAPNHPADYDDVNATVTWDGVCRASGSDSVAQLSNGWTPTFTGSASCRVALRYLQCGGLYANPVVATDAPDPGVMKVGSTYYMATTGGRFPLRKSTDLVHWTSIGSVRPAGQPAWAVSDFWAPELHEVNGGYVAYFSARKSNGAFALGTATATSPQGPYTPQSTPILEPAAPGAIDVHFFRSSAGTNYLLWKIDGNQTPGNPTPIYVQPLSADGLTLTGTKTLLIDHDTSWEGNLVEGPWMIEEGGYFYLFYSANGYASNNYAIGVARASSPTGPFTKYSGNPILKTRGAWAGPGHGSVVKGPHGEWVHVFHAWVAGQVGSSPGRQVLVDRIEFVNGWPRMLAAPSLGSQPMP